jgi:bacillithiol synthase
MAAELVPIRVLPGLPKLFVDYVCDFERVGDLFAHDFHDPAAFDRAAEIAAARDLPREELADLLLAQNRSFGSGGPALANARLLADPDAVAVVTGQQPGLFGGPLYNLYKAATAIRLAGALAARTGRPHVPVFWIASDDHQVGEVDHVHVLDRDGGPVRISWARGPSRRVEPIAALCLDDGVVDALDRVAEISHGLPRRQDVLALLADCFCPGERLAHAFARLAARLFEPDGLVLVESSDPALRRLGMPRLAPELAYPSPATAAARLATERLATRGYPVQVPLRDDSLNLFFGRRERFRIRSGPDGFRVELRSSVVDVQALRARFDAEVEQFSPNVLLRPLYQDALFPTVAYVAGPSEIAYFAQLAPVYERFGIPMPVVYPRKSVTLIDEKVASLLRASELCVEDVLAGAEAPAAAVASLLPDGQPQERVLGLVHALLVGGLELVPALVSGLALEEFGHQVLDVGAAAPAVLASGANAG